MQNTGERAAMVCPLNGKMCVNGKREDFPKDKIGERETCRWWIHLYGKDPQSEKVLDQFDCSIAWLPVTGTEGAQMTRQLTATLDAHRTEMSDNFGKVAQAVTVGLATVAAAKALPSANEQKQIEGAAS